MAKTEWEESCGIEILHITAYENLIEKDLQEVKELIEEFSNERIRIKITFSQNSKNRIKKIIQLLEEIDNIAFEKGFPITLSICRCCTNELEELIGSQRWKSRWKTY